MRERTWYSAALAMALHRYFKTAEKLPNPRGSLSKRVPQKSIVSANEAVRRVMEDADSPTLNVSAIILSAQLPINALLRYAVRTSVQQAGQLQ